VVLWCALFLALFLSYNAWMQDYGASSAAPSAATSTAPSTANSLGQSIPQAATGEKAPAHVEAPPAASNAAAAAQTAGFVRVRTDVLDVQISLLGGTLIQADLPLYPKVKGKPDPVRLENRDSPETLYELRTGLSAAAGEAPTHLALFTSPQSEYTLAPGASELSVPLTWSDAQGVSVTKTFVFRRGEYAAQVRQSVTNHSDMPWQAAAYAQLLRNDPPTRSSFFSFSADRYAFHGPAIFDGTKYRKLKVGDNDDRHLSLEVRGGWLAALQHYFVSAIVPPAGQTFRYSLGVDGNEYALAAAGPVQSVAPGASASFDLTLFIGPKLQAQLEATGPELDRVADYGLLWVLAKPLFWLLEKVHGLLQNWGLAIIVVTFLLKLVFYPLSEASGKSMAKMKALAPRIKNIQETYKDDREKSGRAMMELYQREKINPVAGCLPIVIQIPVFLAFYWVLLETVEMRQAPFLGWINDLSSRDPYFILPAIMAGAMFAQYKLNPAPPDPTQARIMMFMPFVMSFTFAFFPAGLVLYWVTNTILSIAQQWNINRRIEAAAKKT
jgi:YidC/Oxa1 family membrane protein insertase